MAIPRIGLALGSGSARGWAHIGVLQALEEMGVRPAVIAGCSAGALVGGAYACGHLQVLADWLVMLTRKKVLSFFDFKILGGGVIAGERLFDFFRNQIGDCVIEGLPIPFIAIATEMASGREVWLTEGPLLEAVRASLSIPGLMTPCRIGHEWMIDGGLVNPVPVSACRAMKAEVVIAVDVNDGLVRPPVRKVRDEKVGPEESDNGRANGKGEPRFFKKLTGENDAPGVFEVVHSAISIMQDKIVRSRLLADPPDLVLAPRVNDIGTMDFHRAEAAIAAGRRSVVRAKQSILDLIDIKG